MTDVTPIERTMMTGLDQVVAELNDPMVQRQFDLEGEMIEEGRHRYWDRVLRARPGVDEQGRAREGEESRTPTSQCLLRMALNPVREGVLEFLEAANSGKAGRRHMAIKHLRLVDPETAAFLALKRCLDALSLSLSMSTLNIRIGRAIEDEVQLRLWHDQSPHLLEAIRTRFKSGNFQFHRRVLKALARRYDIALGEPWSDNEALQVGSAMLTIVIEKTGLFEVSKDAERLVVKPTEKTIEWVRKTDGTSQFLYPTLMPTVIPPKPWTTPTDGGYYFSLARKLRLVKNKSRGYQSELRSRDMADVYRAVNAMQDTPWSVNTGVLDMLAPAARSSLPLGGLPETHDEPIPLPPSGIPKDKEQRTEAQQSALVMWKSKARMAYEGNTERRQARLVLARTIAIAEKYAVEERFYFPHTLDFRGRAYPAPSFLQPQGCDWQKALLRFANGVPLGEQGACWLAIHGTNLMAEDPTTGEKIDKLSLQGRIDWVFANEAAILAVAADPNVGDLWTKADSPWQFLAFCLEWAGYSREGEAFVSHLPIALDGSCNGLQHFSAMLRDDVGGSAVNLIPHPTPADIYMEVCLATIVHAGEDAEGDTTVLVEVHPKTGKEKHRLPPATLAKRWLASGQLDRALCKRPVMTMPYGSKEFGIRDQLMTEMRKREYVFTTEDGEVSDGWAECGYLAKIIWLALGNVVVKAREAMDWLQTCARQAAKQELPISWATPDGFLVLQEYRQTYEKVVKTQVAGKVLWPRLVIDTDVLAKHRQQNGIAPNFVHSMDAAAMRGCINAALDEGVFDFAMIHDSYATHAGNTEAFYHTIRGAFVEMYVQHDVLSDFRASLCLQMPEEDDRLLARHDAREGDLIEGHW